MNLDELRPILAAYRQQVQAAWTPETAHPDFEGSAGNPTGQCGVTSAWLQKRLREDRGIEAMYCVGTVNCRYHSVVPDHCWLEIGEGLDRVVIDPTSDQIPCIEVSVWCDTWRATNRWAIGYLWTRRLTEDQVSRDPVASRLALLEVGA